MHIDGCLLICLLSALSIHPSVRVCLMNRIVQPAVSHQNSQIESPLFFFLMLFLYVCSNERNRTSLMQGGVAERGKVGGGNKYVSKATRNTKS